jgi:antitoxin (DNA-binding transcriptional repressor) of toxin-antitoxin stability system
MNMKSSVEIINTRQLREEMPRVVKSVRSGKRFLVLHRSRPAFELGPPEPTNRPLPPLEEDPVFGWDGVGASEDGLRAADHDRVLYGA